MANRTERQTEIISKWFDNSGIGTLEAATAFGKTRVALRILREMNNNRPLAMGLVVVPTIFLHDQWVQKIEEWNIKNVQVMVINSVVQIYNELGVKQKVNVLVLDEIHRYVAPEFRKVYECVKYKHVLGLSATIPDDDRMNIIKQKAPIIDTVTTKEALDNEWIAPYIIYNVPVTMTDEERAKYKEYNTKFHTFFSYFDRNLGLVFKVLRDDKALSKIANAWNRSENFIKGQAVNTIRFMNKRKKLLYELDSKLDVVDDVLRDKSDDKMAVVFGQSIDFADKVEDRNPEICRAYHSKVKGRDIDGEYYGADRHRDYIIDQFSNPDSEISVLSTARAFDEGANIPSIEIGIIAAFSSKSLQFIQRIGRVIRDKEGKQAKIIVLYCENTQEERWLKKSQKEISASSIQPVPSINDIDFV